MSEQFKLTARTPARSIEELLDGATSREPFFNDDSKSGALFERVMMDGERYILKHLHVDDDWIMRSTGDLVPRPARVWLSGQLDVIPASIDHAIVNVATGLGRNGWGAALLMRDVSDKLVPSGDDVIPLEQHARFLDDMAALSASAWNWTDPFELCGYDTRWRPFNQQMLACEEALGWPEEIPRIVKDGWQRFQERAPRNIYSPVHEMQADLSPFVDALRRTPVSLLHGDWKMGNLGSHQDGRTVLLDWAGVGEGPVCHELTWYLALNQRRLPESKEASIERLRSSLTKHGIDVDPWWETQLHLCLLGGLINFGWEKALGDEDEFQWWCERAIEATKYL